MHYRYRQYGLWDRYTDLYPDQDLIYNINTSNYCTDWFFAHVTRYIYIHIYVIIFLTLISLHAFLQYIYCLLEFLIADTNTTTHALQACKWLDIWRNSMADCIWVANSERQQQLHPPDGLGVSWSSYLAGISCKDLKFIFKNKKSIYNWCIDALAGQLNNYIWLCIKVRFNNRTASFAHFSTGFIGGDNAIARHGVHGLYWLYTIDVPSDLLKVGENTIYLRQAKSGSPFQGVMYDYLRLEGPPQDWYILYLLDFL